MTDAGSTLSPIMPARLNVSCTTEDMTWMPDATSLKGRPNNPGGPPRRRGCAGRAAAAPLTPAAPAAVLLVAVALCRNPDPSGCRGGAAGWWLSACSCPGRQLFRRAGSRQARSKTRLSTRCGHPEGSCYTRQAVHMCAQATHPGTSALLAPCCHAWPPA